MMNIDSSLFLIVLAIAAVLGIAAYVAQRDVTIAAIGVLGGGVITNYLMATNQEWRWALLATIIATIMFLALIRVSSMLLGIAAALIGVFGSFLSVLLTWNVDLDLNAEDVPIGLIVVIVLIIVALVLIMGARRRRRTVVSTTTT